MDESEDLSDYKIGGYHPVKVGDVYCGRYHVLQKIGYGHFSTVWLCLDDTNNEYVALKIQKSAATYTDAAMDEIDIVSKVQRSCTHPKWPNGEENHIVKISHHFLHRGPHGSHVCIAFELLGINLVHLMKFYEFKGVPVDFCRNIIRQCLVGLNFLHRICGVIHTDIKSENILLKLNQTQIEMLKKTNATSCSIPVIVEKVVKEEAVAGEYVIGIEEQVKEEKPKNAKVSTRREQKKLHMQKKGWRGGGLENRHLDRKWLQLRGLTQVSK